MRRHLVEVRRLVAQIPHAEIAEASAASDISRAVHHFALKQDDLLVVIGGDGSLQAALTALERLSPLPPPDVLIVPAGTTNMSAKDLGITPKPLKVLQGLRHWLNGTGRAPALTPRAVLRIQDSESSRVECGLFFGGGAVVEGVKYFHSHVRPKGIRGALGPSLALISMLLSLLRSNGLPFVSSVDARLHFPHDTLQGRWMVILATTLDTLMLNSTPYWGTEHAPMHFTAVEHRAPQLLRSLVQIMRGRAGAKIRESSAYVSHNLSNTKVEGLKEYLLDGELFVAQGRLELSAAEAIRFAVFQETSP